MPRQIEDLSGRVFGRLTVLGRAPDLKGKPAWRVRCACGTEKDIADQYLADGTKSCGCLFRVSYIIAQTKHGQTDSVEHKAWRAMIDRCNNPRNKAYNNYGGRGIKVCDRWREFANFLADLGPRPDGMSLERKDVNGNYEPSNCKWASYEEQSNNKRGMKKYLVDGEWRTVEQLSRHWNINKRQAKKRAGQYEFITVGEDQ